MLCAAVTACMSPVRCRFSTSIGTTWLYPPPAAPPLMPKVGPMDGCRIATVARLPMCRNPCPSPTVVVVLPSPSGVGLIRDRVELDLHHLLAVGLQQVGGDAHLAREVFEWLEGCAPGNLQVGWESHGVDSFVAGGDESGNEWAGGSDSGGGEAVDANAK